MTTFVKEPRYPKSFQQNGTIGGKNRLQGPARPWVRIWGLTKSIQYYNTILYIQILSLYFYQQHFYQPPPLSVKWSHEYFLTSPLSAVVLMFGNICARITRYFSLSITRKYPSGNPQYYQNLSYSNYYGLMHLSLKEWQNSVSSYFFNIPLISHMVSKLHLWVKGIPNNIILTFQSKPSTTDALSSWKWQG